MFSGDMEDIEKYQIRFLEMKTTMLEFFFKKNTVGGINSRIDVAEEKITESELIEVRTL